MRMLFEEHAQKTVDTGVEIEGGITTRVYTGRGKGSEDYRAVLLQLLPPSDVEVLWRFRLTVLCPHADKIAHAFFAQRVVGIDKLTVG